MNADLSSNLTAAATWSSDRSTKDGLRTRFLESQGYRVLRFWNTDVLRDTEGVMTVIYEALNEAAVGAAPHP